LERQKVGLISKGDDILDAMSKGGSIRNAAFVEKGGKMYIILREGATKREVMHEIGHMMARNKLGPDYWKLSEQAREAMVSSFVRDSSLWKNLLPEEQWAELLNILNNKLGSIGYILYCSGKNL
jgi:predicted acetyltransferase